MTSPRVHARRLRQLATRSFVEFFDDRCPQVAASISYYALFAVFPIAILAIAGFGLVLQEDTARERVIETLLANLPPAAGEARAEFDRVLDGVSASPGAFGVAGLLALLFSASGLMRGIRYGMNTVWGLEDVRSPLAGKLLDVLLVFAGGLVIGASLASTVAIRLAAGVLRGSPLEWLTTAAGTLFPVALSFAVFLFVYRIVPANRTRLRDLWFGALVAAAGYELAKLAFSFYLSNFADYNAVYGSLGAAVAFLFFVFIAANVLLLGAEVASEWPHVRAGAYDELEGGDDGTPLGDQLRSVLRRLLLGGRDPAEDADGRAVSKRRPDARTPGARRADDDAGS